MIRIILITTAFFGVSAALIVFQPGAMQIRDRMAERDPSPVTRAVTTPDSLPRALAQHVDPVPGTTSDVSAVLAALVRDSQKLAVTTQPEVTSNPALAIAAAVKASQKPENGELARTTQAILDQLGKAPARGSEDDALLAMTQGVLAKLGATAAPGGGAPASDLQTLVVQAVRQGQSDAYLDALLNEARNSGQVVVPEALITSDGKVDTATLLASLVQRSVSAGGPTADVLAASTTTRPRARPAGETEIYTVQPGDSLAAISYRYYGDTLRYNVIYEANRDKIATPDKIRVGQKLTIPVL